MVVGGGSMGTEQEILRIGKALEKIVHSDTPNEETALDLLRSLQGLPMNLVVLQKSGVGLSVNKLRKKFDDGEISSVAKKLIKSWKKLVPGQTQKDSKHHTPKSLHHQSHTASTPSPSTSSSITSPQALPSLPSKPPTPPPVLYSPPSASINSSSGHSNITSPVFPNGENSLHYSEETVSTDGVVLVFDSSISGESRLPSTGSDTRDRCRDLLIKALKKGFSDGSTPQLLIVASYKATTGSWGRGLGMRLYCDVNHCSFRDIGNKYKNRIRSRVSNLGDLKNPSLRQNVISGQVPPSKIATMATEEMASDEMKGLRKKFTKDAIRDAQMAMVGGTTTDLLKCSKCKGRKCTYNQAQTRSADEPMTTFAYCNDCGHRWKFC